MPTTRNYLKSRNRTTTRRTTTTNRRRTTTTARNTNKKNTKTQTFTTKSPAFKGPRATCQQRIGSFRNVYQQFNGGTKTPFSPTNANKWIKLVDNGCQVYKWTNKEFCNKFGNQWSNGTPTACYRWMKQRFGNTIKAVTKGKGGCWLVATSGNPNARPFQTYTWK